MRQRKNIKNSVERRRSARYPIREEVRYKLVHRQTVITGKGETINIGSGGVLFSSKERLPIGCAVELAINWPARLDGTCPLQFVAKGQVIRSEDDRAAISFTSHGFYTRGTLQILIPG